jgi:hypothetical protein
VPWSMLRLGSTPFCKFATFKRSGPLRELLIEVRVLTMAGPLPTTTKVN